VTKLMNFGFPVEFQQAVFFF